MNDFYFQVINDQKQEKSVFQTNLWVERENENQIDIESNLAQIVMGVRRSGKSTLAHRVLSNYDYAYINFDDERLMNITSSQLNDILASLYRVYGDFKYLFLDEIQNVEGWHLFVNRLLRSGIHLIITGSNSKLLSTELATHLTGRYNSIKLLPFSFREFILFKNLTENKQTTKDIALLTKAYDEYVERGGFPELINKGNLVSYINDLFQSVVTKDILYRYNIKYIRTFRDVALYLINNFGRELSYNRIKDIFGLGSEHTAKNYVSYLEEAYLIQTLPKFSFKKQESLRYRKSYVIDVALANVLSDNFSQNSGFLLENIVFLELIRRSQSLSYEVFYYKKKYEIDFLVFRNRKVVELIQVALNLEDNKTANRETRALIDGSIELKAENLTIITQSEKRIIEHDGIKINVIPIIDWLLDG